MELNLAENASHKTKSFSILLKWFLCTCTKLAVQLLDFDALILGKKYFFLIKKTLTGS